MNWLTRRLQPGKVEIVKQVDVIAVAAEDNKSALNRLLSKIADIDLEEGLDGLGRDLSNTRRGGR